MVPAIAVSPFALLGRGLKDCSESQVQVLLEEVGELRRAQVIEREEEEQEEVVLFHLGYFQPLGRTCLG